MRNQNDGRTRNINASSYMKEGQSAVVMDSHTDHSSIDRHRKRIFEGRSKSIRTRRNIQQVKGDSVLNNSNNQLTNNPKLMQKVEQMQEQITHLTELLQQKQKREDDEQRKISDIINIKNKEARSHITKIEELTHQLDSKNRELESSRLEIQRLMRCNRIIHQTDHLGQLIEQENGRSLTSFIADTHNHSSLGSNWFKSKGTSLSPSPEKFSKGVNRVLVLDDSRVPIAPAMNDFLSPFSVANIVQEQKTKPWEQIHHNRERNISPLKDNYNHNLISSIVPQGFNHQQIVVRQVTSAVPTRGGTVNTSY